MPQLGAELKLLTINTHKGFTLFGREFMLHKLRDAIRTTQADVVFLQEIVGAHAGHAQRRAGYPQEPHYEFLADSIWSDYAYGRNAISTQGHHGNAVLSKFPIVHHENHNISLNRLERRGLLHCALQISEQTQVHAVCVHLNLRASHRLKQLAKLSQLIDAAVPRHAPLIVAGDFNDWRCQAHQVLASTAGLTEVHVAAYGHAAKTFPARWPLLRLDRIYVRNVATHQPIALPRLPWAALSDHAPLAACVGFM